MTTNNVMRHNDGVALKDYVDTRFESICRNIEKSNDVIDARLHGMNEFRRALEDQTAKLMTKEEYRFAHTPIENDIKELRDFMAKHQGKASQSAFLFTAVVAIVGVIISVIALITGK